MEQRVEALEDEDKSDLEKSRAWVYGSKASARDFPAIEQKLDLIAAMLDSGIIKPDHKWQLQSLGIVFGDALVQAMDLIWVMVEDEYGRDPALTVPKTTMILFPQTAISKRVEDSERVNVFELFSDFCERVAELRARYSVTDQ